MMSGWMWRIRVVLVAVCAAGFGVGSVAASPRPLAVSQLYVDVTDDLANDNDAGVGRTGDVLEVDAPGGVEIQEGGTAYLTVTSSGITLGAALLGTITGVNLDFSGWLDGAGGLRVNGTEIVDASLNLDNLNNDTGTGSFVRATDGALNGTAQSLFTLDSDNAGGEPAAITLGFNRGASGDDVLLRWLTADGEFEFVNAVGTFQDVQMADLSAVNAGLTGTLTGMTNVTGSGNIVLATSPTLVTPVLGVASATSLTTSALTVNGDTVVTGEFDVGTIALDGTEIVDASRNLTNIAAITASGNVEIGDSQQVIFDSDEDSDTYVIGSGDSILAYAGGQWLGTLYSYTYRWNKPHRSNIRGSASGPIYSYWDDDNTGTYSSGTDLWDVTTGGTRAGGFDASGNFDAVGTVTIQGGATVRSGTGSPESAVTGSVGDLFLRTDGGASTTLYVKESGTGNTGWVAK